MGVFRISPQSIMNFDGNKITKTEQVKRCGNSVCPPIAEALVRANVVNLQNAEAV